jgi:SAM-dependent methyltransferase
MARPTKDTQARLKSETAFQNNRTQFGQTEPRDKFNFLADKAKEEYWRLLSNVHGKQVLIAGCAEGGVTTLARLGAIATGVDIADLALQRLREAIRREGLSHCAAVVNMNAEDLQFPTNTFDIVCCSGVLHHLDVAKAASNWARVLKSDGRVVMIEPMAWNPLVALYRYFTPSMRTPDEHPLVPRDIRTLEKHFRRVEVKGYVLTSLLSLTFVFLPNVFKLRERTLKVFEHLDSYLLKVIPQLKYVCWTVVIQLSNPVRA